MKQVKILFSFEIFHPKPAIYRGVKARDGAFRMEKKGPRAKQFRSIMWCGSEKGLNDHREAVLTFCK
jgi:hypothetical protein